MTPHRTHCTLQAHRPHPFLVRTIRGLRTALNVFIGLLAMLAMPVLVIWGMKDKALLPVQLDGLQNHVPDLRWVLVEEAGHFIPWEKPEVVPAAIRDFMAES